MSLFRFPRVRSREKEPEHFKVRRKEYRKKKREKADV